MSIMRDLLYYCYAKLKRKLNLAVNVGSERGQFTNKTMLHLNLIHSFRLILLLLALSTTTMVPTFSQSLPLEVQFSQDGRQLLSGKSAPSGFYDSALVRNLYLNFNQPNYWTQLTTNYPTRTHIPANLVFEGISLDSVGVSFKGNTSYTGTGTSQKKSFSIKTEEFIDNQDLLGYSTLNLNNAFQDASFLREVFYLHQIRQHIPAAKANFVHLYINDQDWGLYPNVQQINKDFLEEWFLSNDGANFRAHVRTAGGPGGGGPGGGGGPNWGDGTAALNYLGADTALYQEKYTLKSSDINNSWQKLVTACDVLNNTPTAQLKNVLPQYFDIDRVLWFLASEIAFEDDDSYVFKGKMDYYIYFDPETQRFTPLEFDGNSVMDVNPVSWGPFYNVNNVNYPLLNKLLTVPEWRQRYLAHFRVILQDELNPTLCNAMLDNFKAQIDALVQSDPKKLYSYNAFVTEVNALKSWIAQRNTFLSSNTEIQQIAPSISWAKYINSDGAEWTPPQPSTPVNIQTQVNSTNGIDRVVLWYSDQLTGTFTQVQMFDDGAHYDEAPLDGIFGASIPGFAAGTLVRFYIEALAGNAAKSAAYHPRGAEHDVFVYQVSTANSSIASVVINELMASNTGIVLDEFGETEDWVELHNTSATAVDLSGFYLSDNSLNLNKWEIPAGTLIQPFGYLVFWADEDSSQGSNHMNFKLSALGETLMLLDGDLNLVDSLSFGAQQANVSLARIPNGFGPFTPEEPTFGYNNDHGALLIDDVSPSRLSLFPNPARNFIRIAGLDAGSPVLVHDTGGRLVYSGRLNSDSSLDLSNFAPGCYVITAGLAHARFIVQH